ncbi:MAG: hypothetical protein IJI45_13415 [Anaerolineaceae bacterium]|nr:hypothetical protein [Anaerolineaceae bacterium]
MKRIANHFLSVTVFFLIFIFSVKTLEFLIVPISRADYFLHDIDRMKKNGENIDMLIIGNSHSLFGFDPIVFEEKLGLDNAYNASIQALQLSSEYLITESIVEKFKPQIIVAEVDWTSLIDYGTERTQYKLLGLDRLTGIRKIRHIINDFEPSERIYAISKLYRFRDNIFSQDIITSNIKVKRWAESTHYEDNYYQTIKGYDKGIACVTQPFQPNEREPFDMKKVSEHNKRYLDLFVKLCKSKNIHLFFVTPPVSALFHMNIGNYQEILDFYKNYAKENDVFYFDMNMLKNRDEIFNDFAFYDDGHLCEPGALAASTVLSKLISDELAGIDTNELFYESMDVLSADFQSK